MIRYKKTTTHERVWHGGDYNGHWTWEYIDTYTKDPKGEYVRLEWNKYEKISKLRAALR